jgi:outer membrane protein
MKHLKYIRFVASLLVAICATSAVNAQKKWTLEECINHAVEQNISVKRTEMNLESTSINLTQSKYSRLPSVNANASNTYNFGQTIDPFTNQFATNTVRSNSFFLNAQVTVFNGFQTLNTIKANQTELQAAESDLQKMKNDISLNVANIYLQILFNKELLRNAESQLEVTRIQSQRIEKLVAAGSQPQGAQFDIDAQLAQEELNRINAKNQLDLSLLNLRQLLLIETAEDFEVIEPTIDNIDQGKVLSTPGAIYENSLTIMPEIKSSEYRLVAAEQSLRASRGAYSPRISLNGSYGTGYSGVSQEIVDVEYLGLQPTGAFVEGTNTQIVAPSNRTTFQDKPFNDQLRDNVNSSIGISLSVPILNGLNARSNVSRSKVQFNQAELALTESKLQLRQQIESAYLDATSASKKYESASASVKALTESFMYTQERFNVGLLNSFDFSNEKNRLIQSQSNLLQAKYEYIFKTQVLEFYQGKTISLKNL